MRKMKADSLADLVTMAARLRLHVLRALTLSDLLSMSLLGTSGISDSTQGHCHRLESVVASRCCPVTAEASFRPTFYLSCNPEYFYADA